MAATMQSFVDGGRDLDAAICAAIVAVYAYHDEMQEVGGKSGENCRRGGGRARGKHEASGEDKHCDTRGGDSKAKKKEEGGDACSRARGKRTMGYAQDNVGGGAKSRRWVHIKNSNYVQPSLRLRCLYYGLCRCFGRSLESSLENADLNSFLRRESPT